MSKNKSSHRLIFNGEYEDNQNHFGQAFFLFLDIYRDWTMGVDWFSRKNIVYVNTCKFPKVEKWLEEHKVKYNYSIEEI